jgi:7,8-dihydropterin-6-yl-methyl-4-(beta-D-ribofuranosyl)aminobenzene 5'-phosphate synthase
MGGATMGNVADFGEAENVAITVLVDNRADLLVRFTAEVKYFTDAPLLAEHGFAALIHLKAVGMRILWDAGVTRIALLENMKRMKVDPAKMDRIALSHGHFDHTASVTDVLAGMDLRPKERTWKRDAPMEELRHWTEGRRVPVIVHPAAFRERWALLKDSRWHGPMLPPPRAEWEAAGAEIVLSEGPHQLAPGCWTTGTIPRLSFEKSGIPSVLFYRDGDTFLPDRIEDDQAIVINVRDKGLVILSGCAHSGIVNTVNYGREISGIDRVWAILGGFHLARATEEELAQSVAEIKKCGPKLIVPSHCTGFRAIARFAAEMPEAFMPGIVGATYLF